MDHSEVGNQEPADHELILSTQLDHSYDRLANRFVKFLCDELRVTPREITILGQDVEDGLGLCIDITRDSFLILVKEDGRDIGQIFTTIAHEMIHVKQYMTQELGRLLDEQKHVPYKERWWEKEAYENAVPLVEKFAKKFTTSH
jgi:hypothetical protein